MPRVQRRPSFAAGCCFRAVATFAMTALRRAAPRALRFVRQSACVSRPCIHHAISTAANIPGRQLQPMDPIHLSLTPVGTTSTIRNFSRGLHSTIVAAKETAPLPVPDMGESITEGTMVGYLKEAGEAVEEDDIVAQIETDKITVDVRAPQAAVVTELLAEDGDVVQVGQAIATLDFSAEAVAAAATAAPSELGSAPATDSSKEADPIPAHTPEPSAASLPSKAAEQAPVPVQATLNMSESGERRVGMSRMRKRIAERLKEAQNTAAMLTTFNEVDMSALMDLRKEFKDDFEKKHGAKLGFMSAFVKASSVALIEQPEVNAFIDGSDIVYRDYVDISVAVSTPKGLVVPAIRGCENMNFAVVEKTIVSLGDRARKGELTIDEMQGGTFTISNGGVFGSLLSTPIINMPQSAILGMHIIQKRPIVVNDQIVIRPMMYLALSYDHRLIDGREAVTFLKRIKTLIEDPRRLLLDID